MVPQWTTQVFTDENLESIVQATFSHYKEDVYALQYAQISSFALHNLVQRETPGNLYGVDVLDDLSGSQQYLGMDMHVRFDVRVF